VILRRFHGDGECFVELDDAVRAMTDRVVVFNCNYGMRPAGGEIVYNTDFVGIHCNPEAWRGLEIWDFCQRNIALYPPDIPVTHVPIGYHASMKRFERRSLADRDVDLVFAGALNPRRQTVLDGFRKAGLTVVWIDCLYGAKRDAIYARSKLALNMRFYEEGVYTTVRASHLVANGVPMLSETSPEMPAWAGDHVGVDQLVDAGIKMLKDHETLDERALKLQAVFEKTPWVLPP
jgi:hypothetical protein